MVTNQHSLQPLIMGKGWLGFKGIKALAKVSHWVPLLLYLNSELFHILQNLKDGFGNSISKNKKHRRQDRDGM